MRISILVCPNTPPPIFPFKGQIGRVLTYVPFCHDSEWSEESYTKPLWETLTHAPDRLTKSQARYKQPLGNGVHPANECIAFGDFVSIDPPAEPKQELDATLAHSPPTGSIVEIVNVARLTLVIEQEHHYKNVTHRNPTTLRK